jgi:serine/threonine-protein kinase
MTKLLVLILFLPFNLFAQDTTVQWRSYQKSIYSIDFPTSWELVSIQKNGLEFTLSSPQVSPADQFRENINLLVQDLTGMNLDLKAFTELSVNQIKSYSKNGNLIENKNFKKETEYQKLIYTAEQNGFQLKFEQYFWIIGSKAYILTFTTEAATFDQYKIIGEKILNSFRLIKQVNFS